METKQIVVEVENCATCPFFLDNDMGTIGYCQYPDKDGSIELTAEDGFERTKMPNNCPLKLQPIQQLVKIKE